jgi:hypothetical protein
MLTPRTIRVLWLVAGVLAVFLALKLWPIPVAAALGTAAGALVGANLPDKVRLRLRVRLPFVSSSPLEEASGRPSRS